jgi:hypothetical protein
MTARRAVLAALALGVALPAPSRAQPGLRPPTMGPVPAELATRPMVTVRPEPGLEGVGRRLAAASDAALAAIAEDLPDLPVPRSIEIRVVSDAAAMQGASPPDRRVPPWAAGVAFPDLGIVVVATHKDGRPLEIVEVTKHELAHLALGAALGQRAPRWLHEGFAYQHSADWTWERTETLAGMAWGNSIIPLEDLDLSFPAAELPANRAYAESYDFVGYLAKRGRWEDTEDDGDRYPFRKFLAGVARTGDLDAAATAAYGRPLRDLFAEWKQDLSRRFVWIPAGLFALLVWLVASILLVLAFLRRRRQNRARLADWDREEAAAAAAAAAAAMSTTDPPTLPS